MSAKCDIVLFAEKVFYGKFSLSLIRPHVVAYNTISLRFPELLYPTFPLSKRDSIYIVNFIVKAGVMEKRKKNNGGKSSGADRNLQPREI